MNDAIDQLEEFAPARFAGDLGLPESGLPESDLPESDLPSRDLRRLKEAAAAVHQEYRDSSRWKRLKCIEFSVFAERDRGAIYVVHLGKAVDFDWTWEGAKAFCPSSIDDENSNAGQSDGAAGYSDDLLWSGEIVEVDERTGCLFVALDDPEAIPQVGSFFVRPFEFLAVLDAIYNADEFDEVRKRLPPRLVASEGEVHPKISQATVTEPTASQPTVSQAATAGFEHLADWWSHSWSVLWGPPGTGKTWTTGQQIARVLNDADERILIVSTTNKATDAVALSLGEAAKDVCPGELERESLIRIGKGASLQTFVDRELRSMLAGTESEILSRIDTLAQQLPLFDSWEEKALTRKQIAELRAKANDQSNRIFVQPDKRVVMATAFKAMSYLRHDIIREMIQDGEAPFTTVVIDEAGLISRTAVAALSLLASRRVALVGDSKQLAPISRISRVLPTRQQTWLASSGLSHLEETSDVPPAVHLLSEQHRMHPDVCDVVSDFQYNGVLTTAEARATKESTLSPLIADASRTIWYVLDEEDCDLDVVRANRGPGNGSWVRDITREVLQKLFKDRDLRNANGLFISPFKAQAQSVSSLLVEWKMNSWEASTVHSQQGSEADIVVFDTVNASNHTWSVVEWKRLVNVALSRAREAVIVLASRSEMEEPYLRPLKRHLKSMILSNDDSDMRWQPVETSSPRPTAVAEKRTSYLKQSTRRMGDQFAERKEMKPILSQEQQRLTSLKLDGKPRLVRGVAGSGKSIVLCNWLAKTAKRFGDTKDGKIWAVYANRSLHKLLCDSIEAAWKELNQDELFGRTEFPWEHVELLHVRDVLSGMLPSVRMTMSEFGFDYDRAAEEYLIRQDVNELLPRCSALFIDEAQDMGPSTLRLLLSVVQKSCDDDPNSRSAHLFYDDAQNVYGTKTPAWSDFDLDMRGRSTIMKESFRSTRPITELAINVLVRLRGSEGLQEQQELITLGLIEESKRNGQHWLEASFSQVDGPKPIYHSFDDRRAEMKAIALHLRHLIQIDGISPTDICVLYNGGGKRVLESDLVPKLNSFGVELSFQTNRSFERKRNTLIATTPHSFKGYESEVVVIPCVDQYVAAEGKLISNGLYVAMTRARSLLAIYGVRGTSEASRTIGQTIESCIHLQRSVPSIETEE